MEEINDEGYTPLMEASREGHLVCFNAYFMQLIFSGVAGS